MTVKIEDIREGDEVLVRLTYARGGSARWGIFKNTAGEDLCVHETSIAQHIPRKIKVGDVCLDRGCQVVVVAIADGDAWVTPKSIDRPSSAMKHYTVRLDNLERVS